jgi:predicted DNA-binding transcriptional regulator
MSLVKVTEYLENAVYNCNTLIKQSPPSLLLEMVKEQIQSAMKEIEKEYGEISDEPNA